MTRGLQDFPDHAIGANFFTRHILPSKSEPAPFDQSPTWRPKEIPLGDGSTLVLENS